MGFCEGLDDSMQVNGRVRHYTAWSNNTPTGSGMNREHRGGDKNTYCDTSSGASGLRGMVYHCIPVAGIRDHRSHSETKYETFPQFTRSVGTNRSLLHVNNPY